MFVGYRAWMIKKDTRARDMALFSEAFSSQWKKENLGICRKTLGSWKERASACATHTYKGQCTCGYYSYEDSLRLLQNLYLDGSNRFLDLNMAIGSVIHYGNVVTHREGFRSNRAIISGLWIPDSSSEVYKETILHLAKIYDCEVIKL